MRSKTGRGFLYGMRQRRWLKPVLFTLGAFGALVFGIGLVSAPGLAGAARYGFVAKGALLDLKMELGKYDFTAAHASADRANIAFSNLQRSVNTLVFWRVLPVFSTQYRAISTLAMAGTEVSRSLSALVDVGQTVLEPVRGRPNLTLASITPGERAAVLAAFQDAEPSLITARDRVVSAEATFEAVPRKGLLPPVRRAVDLVAGVLPDLADGLRAAVPATRLVPPLIGLGNPVTYLFLLENNSELRPGGGFIGTYGLLTVKDGEIVSFSTENVYNLDDRVKTTRTTTPPAPLTRYNRVGVWFLRDSNWSPDFPTDADIALRFYREEGGTGKPQGVIAVTPTAIQTLLSVTGPITVNGLTFTPENFLNVLQEQVDQGYLRAGLPTSERKEIIGVLAQELIQRLEQLPQSNWGDLWTAINRALKSKQVLFYHSDANLQSKILEEGWGGHIAPSGGDTLMLVDANLASLKTDPAVTRQLDYTVHLEGPTPTAELTVTYRHAGTFTWKTTRYRTYLRVYVPKGSELTASSGAEKRDRSDAAGTVDVSEDLGFEVFGAFKSVEPGATESLRFQWKLPTAMAEGVTRGDYRLTVFKQAGAMEHTLNATLRFPKHATVTEHPFGVDVPNGSSVGFLAAMDSDLHFRFSL